MSLADWLVKERTPMELAKELAKLAHENAALKNRVGELEHQIFWMQVAERTEAAS